MAKERKEEANRRKEEAADRENSFFGFNFSALDSEGDGDAAGPLGD